jgi:hypothetical protein
MILEAVTNLPEDMIGRLIRNAPDESRPGREELSAAPSVHAVPGRCGFRAGSAADGHGTPASFSARAIRATLCPASRCANIHLTTCAVSGSGSRRCARRPHAACALFGCGPASASRYPYGGRPPRYRPCRVCSAIAVRTLILVLVTSRLDDRPSIVIARSSCSQP